jgi:hypothetical protein
MLCLLLSGWRHWLQACGGCSRSAAKQSVFDALVLRQQITCLLSFGSIEVSNIVAAMPRVTLSIAEREHMALKLLALQRNQKMVAVIELAIKKYLDDEGAYDLAIRSLSDPD